MMRYNFGALFVAALILGAGTSAMACSQSPLQGLDAQVKPGAGFDQRLLDTAIRARVNLERCKVGLGPLAPADGVRQVAFVHSEWMAQTGQLSHDGGPAGQASVFARLSGTGVPMSSGAENIATAHVYRVDGIEFQTGKGKCDLRDASGRVITMHSYGSLAAEVVANWMASPGHRQNILDPQVRFTGAAAAFADEAPVCGIFYVTQDFVG